MSQHYRTAQENHHRNQLREYYDRQSQSDRDVPFYSRGNGRFEPQPYSMLQHYLPHGIGVGSIVIVGTMGLLAYNSHIKDSFESVYFSSW